MLGVPLEITGAHTPEDTKGTGWPQRDDYEFFFGYDGTDGKGHKGAATVTFELRGSEGTTIEDFVITNGRGLSFTDRKNWKFSFPGEPL